MIPRQASAAVTRMAEQFPAVVLTGPRQSGETTLARALFSDRPFVSLEELRAHLRGARRAAAA